MSYVLEALKKQEAERDPGAAASLARAAERARRRHLWQGLFAAAMVLNAGLLIWLLGQPWGTAPAATATDSRKDDEALSPGAEPRSAAPAAAGLGSAPSVAADSAPAPAPSTAGTPASEPPRAAAASPAQDAPLAQNTPPPQTAPPAAAPPRRIPLAELPAPARRRFPGLAFSTHVYAEDADLRAIVANGKRLVEGDRIRGLRVHEITSTGVVLAFEDYLVEIPVVSAW